MFDDLTIGRFSGVTASDIDLDGGLKVYFNVNDGIPEDICFSMERVILDRYPRLDPSTCSKAMCIRITPEDKVEDALAEYGMQVRQTGKEDYRHEFRPADLTPEEMRVFNRLARDLALDRWDELFLGIEE